MNILEFRVYQEGGILENILQGLSFGICKILHFRSKDETHVDSPYQKKSFFHASSTVDWIKVICLLNTCQKQK